MNNKFNASNFPIRLYRTSKSGHCHRVELMLSFLNLPYECIDLDVNKSEQKITEFIKINPFEQVPIIDDNGIFLSDSNAIIIYLATKYSDGYEWLPKDPVKIAEVQRWLSVAAGDIAYGPCAVRLVKLFGASLDYDRAKPIAASLFTLLELHLESRQYLTGDRITLADVAGYSYISHVPERGDKSRAFSCYSYLAVAHRSASTLCRNAAFTFAWH